MLLIALRFQQVTDFYRVVKDIRCGMAEFEVVLTECYAPEAGKAIAANLRAHISVGHPNYFVRRSLGEFPQFIQLIADQTIWKTAFGVAATAFLGRLGYRLADITWDQVTNLFGNKGSEPLVEAARILSDAKQQANVPVTLNLGVNISNRYTPAFLHVPSDDPAEIAYAIAIFVAKMPLIIEALEDDTAANVILGDPAATIVDNGNIFLTWHTFIDNEIRKRSALIT